MRHRKKHTSNFGLKRGPRRALMRGLVTSLAKHERIRTTLPKAKALRPLIEKAITLGRKDSVHTRRLLLSKFPNKETVSNLVKISQRFLDCPGGYTRIVKLGTRPGDQAPKALIEFKDYKFTPKPSKEEVEKRKASKEYQKERKAFSKKVASKKKHLRTIQKQSRLENR